MVFEITYWKDRLESAKTQEDFSRLLKDLPDNPSDMAHQDSQKPVRTLQPKVTVPLILNTRKGMIVVG